MNAIFQDQWMQAARVAASSEPLPFVRLLERASGLPAADFTRCLGAHMGLPVLGMQAMLDCEPDHRAWGFAAAASCNRHTPLPGPLQRRRRDLGAPPLRARGPAPRDLPGPPR